MTIATNPKFVNNNKKINWPNYNEITYSPKQAEIIKCKSKRIALNCGRAFGKDEVLLDKGLLELFKLYCKRIGDKKFKRKGAKAIMMVVAPELNNSLDLWHRVIDKLPEIGGIAKNGKSNIHIKNEEKVIEIFGGDILIYFNSTVRQDSLRGRGIDILIVTECAYLKESVLIKVLIPFCIRPNYAGIVYLNSTPKGKGYYWDTYIFEWHFNKGFLRDLGFVVFQGTFFDNPTTTQDVVTAFEATFKKNIYDGKREWLGHLHIPVLSDFYLNAGEELAFNGILIKNVLLNHPVQISSPYVVGMDVAGNGKDNLCVAVLDCRGIVVYLEKHSKTSQEDIIKIILRINKMFRPRAFAFDSNKMYINVNDGKLVSVPLIPIQSNNEKKNLQVAHFLNHLTHQTIRIPNPEFYYNHVPPPSKYMVENLHLLLNEMYMYKKYTCLKQKINKSKIEDEYFISYHKPVDGSDDMLDAVMMAAEQIVVPFNITEIPDIPKESDKEDEETTPVSNQSALMQMHTNSNRFNMSTFG